MTTVPAQPDPAAAAPSWSRAIRAVLFDYGNTLIEYGPRQLEQERENLLEFLGALGTPEVTRFQALRARQILRPYQNGWRENDPPTVCAELIRETIGRAPTPSEIDALDRRRQECFVHIVATGGAPPESVELLMRLHGRCKLALVSNYPWGRAIRRSLEALNWDRYFNVVVVSGDLGYVKPDARPFQATLRALNLAPEQCLFVGDNWLADVQGAARLGMRTAWTRQYTPYETFAPQPGDLPADLMIPHLRELLPALGWS